MQPGVLAKIRYYVERVCVFDPSAAEPVLGLRDIAQYFALPAELVLEHAS